MPATGATIWAMTALLCIFSACGGPRLPEPVSYGQCSDCHQGIEQISPSHDFECKVCHLRPEQHGVSELRDHPAVVRNPSDPRWVSLFCGKCHEKEIAGVRTSLHSTMAGIINQTRYLWGAQEAAFPPVYSANDALTLLPNPVSRPETPADLVDDFLRRKCLRCHLQTRGAPEQGLYRASGCAACHVPYGDEGRYEGQDKAIDKTRPGYPRAHRFTRDIPDRQCMRCHNQNHVGADYHGLFERDHHRTYRSETSEGVSLPRLNGSNQHHLSRDVHAQKGLWCIDCHRKNEIMGDGNLYGYALAVPMIQCSDCHGGFFEPGPNLALESIEEKAGVFFFRSRHTGKTYRLSIFSRETPSHAVSGHPMIRCSACHAQWSFQDYGLSVTREDFPDYDKWSGLTDQGDPYVKGFLEEQLKKEKFDAPVSPDWLDGMEKPGMWFSGWRLRRWEWMPLGLDQNGRYSIMRPKYQYFVSYIDPLGNVCFDSEVPRRGDGRGLGWAFMPYVPHTISPVGRSCESCHLNPAAAGRGIFEGLTADLSLTVPSPPVIAPMALLSEETRNKLLNPSTAYKAARLRSIIGEQNPPGN